MNSTVKSILMWTATLAFAAMAAAVTYQWKLHHVSPAPRSTAPISSAGEQVATRAIAATMVPRPQAGSEEFVRALADMESRMAALAAQISNLKQQHASNSGQDTGANTPGRDENERGGDDAAEAQETLMEAAIANEQPDPRWAPMAETTIKGMFEDQGLQALRLVDARCRTTVCRIEVAENESAVDGESFDQSFRRLLIRTPWQGQGFGRAYNPFGPSPSGVLFLAREGNDLPQTAH
jgi:TolA-binding protein